MKNGKFASSTWPLARARVNRKTGKTAIYLGMDFVAVIHSLTVAKSHTLQAFCPKLEVIATFIKRSARVENSSLAEILCTIEIT